MEVIRIPAVIAFIATPAIEDKQPADVVPSCHILAEGYGYRPSAKDGGLSIGTIRTG